MSLSYSDNTSYTNKGIFDTVNKISSISDTLPIIILHQKDFSSGTYRIKTSGIYKLSENIEFNPNPGDWDSETKTFKGDNDWMPLPEQKEEYPFSPYHLGFFSAITIEVDNVIIDLNDKTICQSRDHFLQQRFFSCIELANKPFIPSQGPSDFGSDFFAPSYVKIMNGYIGLSSHHGIHGNGMKNIILEDLYIYNFEIAGISLNGSSNTLIKNVKVDGTVPYIPVNATYSQSRFIRSFLQKIKKDFGGDGPIITLKNSPESATSLLYKLNREMNIVYHDYIYSSNSLITSNFYRNYNKLSDGNVYGIVLAQKGVVIGKFIEKRLDEEFNNENIVLDSVKISNITSCPSEIVGLSVTSTKDSEYGLNVQKGPIGDVLRILNCKTDDGLYKPNVLSQSQFYIASVLGNGKMDGTNNIQKEIFKDWSNDLILFNELPFYLIGGGDSMAHSMKGNIGLFISGLKDLYSNEVMINHIENKGEYSLSKDKYTLPKNDDIEYEGNFTRGVAIVGSYNINLNSTIDNVNSLCSGVIGIDILGQCKDISGVVKILNLESSAYNYYKPNKNNFVKLINNIEKTNF